MGIHSRNLVRGYFALYCIWVLLGDSLYNFMLLNVFLAYIPIELSFYIEKHTINSTKLFYILSFMWLLFYPNGPYLFTDLLHFANLNPYTATPEVFTTNLAVWYSFSVLVVGVVGFGTLEFASLERILDLYQQKFTSKYVYPLLLLLISFLASVGIYIGRFLRLHSVDLILHPFQTLKEVLTMWSWNTMGFVVLITLLQFILFSMYKLSFKKS